MQDTKQVKYYISNYINTKQWVSNIKSNTVSDMLQHS